MAKGLYINKSQLEQVIIANYDLEKIELKNPTQGFYRYYIGKEEREFILDVFYTKKGTTTITAHCEDGQELEQAIINSIEYKEVRSGSFSAVMSEKSFDSLVELLVNVPNILVSEPDDKGYNGVIYKVTTDYGDSVTLTYFKSNNRLLYQGLMMKLYSIIKSNVLDINNSVSITETDLGEKTLDDKVQLHIDTYFPNGWSTLEPTIQGFIKDGFALVEVNTKLSDYAAWVMPIMRVLEYRIKKVCLDYDVIINDSKGFRYYTNIARPNATDWIFRMDFSTDTVLGVNPNINNMPQVVQDSIVECYDYLRKNRHEMFHATQILSGIKLVETSADAFETIVGACEVIEKSIR